MGMIDAILEEFKGAVRTYENTRLEAEAEANPLGRRVSSVRASGEGAALFYEGQVCGLSVALLKLGIASDEIDRIQREVTEEVRDEMAKAVLAAYPR